MMKASCTIILIVAQQLLVHFTGNQFFPLAPQWNFFYPFQSIFQNQLHSLKVIFVVTTKWS